MQWLLVVLVVLALGGGWSGVGGGAACVLCSPRAGSTLAELLGPFLARALPGHPQLRAAASTRLLRGTMGLARLPPDPESFMGVIDEATLEEAATHFERTMVRVMQQDLRDEQLFNELMWAIQEVKENFKRLMTRFQKEVFCPNTCGRMEVVWIECLTCNTTLFACSREVDCGDHELLVEEGEQLRLDCSLPWHRSAHGSKTYSFYRLMQAPPGTPSHGHEGEIPLYPRPPPGKGEELLASGPDPLLVWNEVARGWFRCEMRDTRGEVASEMRFHVKVIPSTGSHQRTPPPPPTPAPPPPPEIIVISVISCVVVVAAIIGGVTTWLRRRRRRRGPLNPSPD